MSRSYQVVFADDTVAQIPANDCGAIGSVFVCFLDDKNRVIAAYPAQTIKCIELMQEPSLVLVKKS